MHTISMLRRTLGLSSDNQVRNRMERIKDLLGDSIRRGPNNQIFLTDAGLDLMRQFQELHDSGLTLAEASHVLTATVYKPAVTATAVSSGLSANDTKPIQSNHQAALELQSEIAQLRDQILTLQEQLTRSSPSPDTAHDRQPWWAELREDVDAT